MTTNEKISALRAAAKAAGGNGVLLMTSDPHCVFFRLHRGKRHAGGHRNRQRPVV